MGEMADDSLEKLMDVDEVFTRCGGMSFHELNDLERELIYDYDGVEYGAPFAGWNPDGIPIGPGPLMTFGKYNRWPIACINTGYLRYAVEKFDKMKPDIREAMEAELQRRTVNV